jgi:hypothetical protein
MLKPLSKLTIPKSNKIKVRSCLQDAVLQTPITLMLQKM